MCEGYNTILTNVWSGPMTGANYTETDRMLEEENNRQIAGLAGKISQLKSVMIVSFNNCHLELIRKQLFIIIANRYFPNLFSFAANRWNRGWS